MGLFFISSPKISNETVKLSEAESHHLMHVLRKKTGDSITLMDGHGLIICGKIFSIDQKEIEIKIIETKKNDKKPPFLILYQALLKNPRMDWLVEKMVELGVSAFVPFIPERAVIKIESEKDKINKVQRWERIAIAALKQSGRTNIPQIGPILTFEEVIQKQENQTIKIVFDLSKDHPFEKLTDLIRLKNESSTYSILIGPEGGFSSSEIKSALEGGFHLVSLGKQTLRAETAAIKVLSVFNFLKEEGFL